MSNKKTFLKHGVVSLFMLIFFSGCYKDITVPLSATAPEVVVTKTVSFSGDILPMFSASCALSGCHASGGKRPDLSSASAYASLQTGNYYSVATPSSSEVYLWLSGKRSTQMPPNGTDPAITATILAWIKQGAKNN